MTGLDEAALVSKLLAVARFTPVFQNPGGEFCSAAERAIWRAPRES
jgi:hypothetical protein